jgi:hypothetical protein
MHAALRQEKIRSRIFINERKMTMVCEPEFEQAEVLLCAIRQVQS